jgi:3-dehydroquinate dehydratase-2
MSAARRARGREAGRVSKPVYVLNGPNLNRLGRREPAIYGTTTLAGIEAICRAEAGAIPLEFRQSNREYQLVDWIHEAIDEARAIVINPAAFSFTSIALVDALKMFGGRIVEVHLSNIHAREAMYRHSLVSPVATGVIAGLGPAGYRMAVRMAIDAEADVARGRSPAR